MSIKKNGASSVYHKRTFYIVLIYLFVNLHASIIKENKFWETFLVKYLDNIFQSNNEENSLTITADNTATRLTDTIGAEINYVLNS